MSRPCIALMKRWRAVDCGFQVQLPADRIRVAKVSVHLADAVGHFQGFGVHLCISFSRFKRSWVVAVNDLVEVPHQGIDLRDLRAYRCLCAYPHNTQSALGLKC